MSQATVYLCPSCQSVVKSENEKLAGLVCGDCGFEFGGKGMAQDNEPSKKVDIVKVTGVAPTTMKHSIVRDVMKQRGGSRQGPEVIQPPSVHEMALREGAELEHKEIPPGEDEVILKDGTRMVRRKKRKKDKDKHQKLYFFLTLWIGIAAAILIIVQMNNGDKDGSVEDRIGVEENRKKEHQIFLGKHMAAISQNFSRFIRAQEDSDRIQEIDYSSRLASKFSRFHQSQSIPVPVGSVRGIQRNVIVLKEAPFTPAVEVVWQDEGGNIFESVHLWDGKDWKLDWEHFSRYATTPWTLFRSKLGQKEGEFRLLMRQREVMKESAYISILFYEEPPVGTEDSRKALQASESEEVIVKLRTDLGRQLTELFKAKEDGNTAYDSIFGQNDPDTMIRVSAALAWEEDEDGDEVLVLKDLLGVSWYGTRVRRAYREMLKLQEVQSDNPVLPSSALKKEPLKD